MTAIVLRGDARQLPLPDGCVDLIVTSPPYFGLRSYTDGGEHYGGQIGSEATPAEYVAALVECTAEWMRVLKPSGSMFVNLGDKYNSAASGQNGHLAEWSEVNARGGSHTLGQSSRRTAAVPDMRPKSLLGLPWRYALACTDQLGLILRRDIIWAKPNGLPESVTDRCRSSHEYLFHLVKQPRYYAAVDEIREPHARMWDPARPNGTTGTHGRGHPEARPTKMQNGMRTTEPNPLGNLPGSVWRMPDDDTVWDIASQPLTVPAHLGVDHFAAFPMELPRRCVLGWSPSAVCADCGFLLGSSYDYGMLGVRSGVHPSRQARPRPALLQQAVQHQAHRTEPGIDHVPPSDDTWLCRGVEAGSPDGAEEWLPDGAPAANGRAPGTAARPGRGGPSPERDQDGQPHRESGAAGQGRARPAPQASTAAVRMSSLRRSHPHRLDAEHACPHCGSDRLRPSVTVDPFGGTGTTALVAAMHGRIGVSIDRSADYTRLARWRCADPGERAKALQVPKPPPIPDGMEALF